MYQVFDPRLYRIESYRATHCSFCIFYLHVKCIRQHNSTIPSLKYSHNFVYSFSLLRCIFSITSLLFFLHLNAKQLSLPLRIRSTYTVYAVLYSSFTHAHHQTCHTFIKPLRHTHHPQILPLLVFFQPQSRHNTAYSHHSFPKKVIFNQTYCSYSNYCNLRLL